MASVKWLPVMCVLVLLQIVQQVAAKSFPLPSYIKPCSRDNPNMNQCALEHGREALPFFIKGNPKISLPVLDPLMIPEVRVDQGGGGSVSLSLINRNLIVTGLKDSVIQDVTIDLQKQHFGAKLTVPRLEINSEYEINGKILILPIKGKGDSNCTLEGIDLLYQYDFDLVERGGEKFIQVATDDLKFTPSGAHLHLTNLFNGDKLLGDNMNRFLNENWRDVIQEIGPSIAEGVKKIMKSIINGVMSHISYDALHPLTG